VKKTLAMKFCAWANKKSGVCLLNLVAKFVVFASAMAAAEKRGKKARANGKRRRALCRIGPAWLQYISECARAPIPPPRKTHVSTVLCVCVCVREKGKDTVVPKAFRSHSYKSN